MLSYNEVLKNALPGIYLVDNGYTGETCKVKLSLVNNDIFEVSESGYYRAPIHKAIDKNEVFWLVKNNPTMRNRYKLIQETIL